MKCNFSGLFSKAWLKTVTPETICSGFRTPGVYPYNPSTVKLPDEPSSNPIHQSGAATVTGMAPASSVASIVSLPSVAKPFTQEQEALFQVRYEEQYDVYDPEYVSWLDVYDLSWLEANHPEAVPADRYKLITASTTVSAPTASPLVMVPTAFPLMKTPTASPSVTAQRHDSSKDR